MKLKIVIDYTNTKHTRVKVFQDGGLAGTLTMETPAMYTFITVLEQVNKEYFELEVVKDDNAS